MKIINLLPKLEQKEVRLHFFARQLIIFWLWVLISMTVVLILGLAARIYLNNQSALADEEIATKTEQLKTSNNQQLKDQVDNLNTEIQNIKEISSQHYYWSGALVELSKLVPADMHIDLLSFDRSSGEVQVTGTSDTRDSVLQFWSDIHKSAYFKNINFPLANLQAATNDPYSFIFYVNPSQLEQPQ